MTRYLTFLLVGSFLFAPGIRSKETDKSNCTATQGAQTSKPALKLGRIDDDKVDVRPKLKRAVPPIYPLEAKQKGIQGSVQIHVIVGKDGKVLKAELVSGDPLLAKSALACVRQWEYQPALLNDEPVETGISVELQFKLSLPLDKDSQSAS